MGIPPGRLETQIKALREEKKEAAGTIPVPPKYKSSDFKSSVCSRLRSKLDVPKERFISCPGCVRETDQVLVIAWAGWDHLQQARALAAYYEKLRQEGASEPRLLLVLAGLHQLIPWLLQWHNDQDPNSA